jgi:hypothetical protein
MNNNERQIVENIRKGYEEKKVTKLDELKELDRRTKRPAEVFAYIFGSVGALVLGGGMCLAMPEIIEGYMALGIGVGLVGIIMVSVNYFIYKAHLGARRRKASGEIFRLSNEILGNA